MGKKLDLKLEILTCLYIFYSYSVYLENGYEKTEVFCDQNLVFSKYIEIYIDGKYNCHDFGFSVRFTVRSTDLLHIILII